MIDMICPWRWARYRFIQALAPPNATDRIRGRRPGTQQDLEELLQLTEHFDVLHTLPPIVEPQDMPPAFRHLRMLEAKLRLSGKIPSVYGRGTPQAEDSFEMIRRFRGLDARGAFALNRIAIRL